MTAVARSGSDLVVAIPGDLNRVGWVAPAGLTRDEWIDCGRKFSLADAATGWWIGDWWIEGQKRDGWGAGPELCEAIDVNYDRARVNAVVCGRFDLLRRRNNLHFAHHEEVARLDPVAADTWLDRAESNKWSQKQLRQAIKQDKLLSLQAAAAAQSGNGIGTIAHCAYSEFLPGIADGSVDLLLTDPPYMTDVDNIESFCKWVTLALPKVKPTGRAYIWTGAYADELAAYLNVLRPWCARTGWEIGNVLVWTYRNTMGPSPGRVYKQNWQACFYLVGPDAGPLDCDLLIEKFTVFDIAAPMDGRLHTWQKPDELGEMIVRHASKTGDVVLDCFAGTGTFLSAAIRQGRNAVGCDADAKMVDLCVRRGLRRE